MEVEVAAYHRWLAFNRKLLIWAKSTKWPGEDYVGWIGGQSDATNFGHKEYRTERAG